MAATGPLEVLVMGFPGEGLPDGAGAVLERIQEDGEVRVVEALMIVKAAPGLVRSEEVTDLVAVADATPDHGPAEPPEAGLVPPDRVEEIGAAMRVDTTALALVLEHCRAPDIVAAFGAVGGVMLASSVVPEATRLGARFDVAGAGG
jgi:Family of unknown function (DUF6325)